MSTAVPGHHRLDLLKGDAMKKLIKLAMKKLIKLALMVGAVAVAARFVGAKKAEWEGLTESQVRDKLDARMPDRVPDEKRAAVADKVIAAMRSRGKLVEDKAGSDGDNPVEGGSDE